MSQYVLELSSFSGNTSLLIDHCLIAVSIMCWSKCSHSYTMRWRNSSASFTFVLYHVLHDSPYSIINWIQSGLLGGRVMVKWILASHISADPRFRELGESIHPAAGCIDTSQWCHESVTIYKEYLTHSEMNFTLLWSALTGYHLLHFLLRLTQIWQRNDEKFKWLFLWATLYIIAISSLEITNVRQYDVRSSS